MDNVFLQKEQELPQTLQKNEFLIKVYYLSIDPVMHVWLSGAPSYLPPLKIGEVIHAYGVGEVIKSENDSWKVGDKCLANTGAQQYCLMDQKRQTFMFRIPKNTSQEKMAFYLPFFNNWFVAYSGIKLVGKVTNKDTVLVSSAAGATGIVCVQLAKLLGAKRVVGIAGSEEKCQFLKEKLKVDEAINYKDKNFNQLLKQACPQGIDVYFDNVGEKMLDDVIKGMNQHGRIALCGATSNYSDHKNRRGLYNLSLCVTKRIHMQGVLASDVIPVCEEVQNFFFKHIEQGNLVSYEHYFNGIENVEKAMQYCFMGSNIGKVLVKLHQDSPKL